MLLIVSSFFIFIFLRPIFFLLLFVSEGGWARRIEEALLNELMRYVEEATKLATILATSVLAKLFL